MSLLQLLVDMVDDIKGVRRRFATDPDGVLTAYGVTDGDERNAAKSENPRKLFIALKKSTGSSLVGVGEKKVTVTFCGVMKGIGGGGGGGDPDSKTRVARGKKGSQKNKRRKTQRKQK